MSLYHGYKNADQAFGNILQSLVLFDELHHYETRTVSAINEALAVLRLLRVPHLIMTATIPNTRIHVLNNGRPPGEPQDKYAPLVSDGREEKPPPNAVEPRLKESFTFLKCDEPMVRAVRDENGQVRYEVSQALLSDLAKHRHLRQIVFVNQVEKAKAVARAATVAGLPFVLCYHAEFIGRDRNDKEEQIRKAFQSNEPCLLVATQIAELSLDISAERMHSEIAPLDDIAQRGGRLNRNGVTPANPDTGQPYEMIVHALEWDNSSDVLPYVNLKDHLARTPPGTPHLLQRSWTILPVGATYRFDSVRDWVNTLYDQHEPLTHPHFQAAVQEDIVFGSKPQDRFGDKGDEGDGQVLLRAKEYETFDVVPRDFEGKLTDEAQSNRDYLLSINQFKYWKADRAGLIERRPVSIKVFKRRSGKSEHESRTYLILKRNYSPDYGINFTGEPEYETETAAPPKDPGTLL